VSNETTSPDSKRLLISGIISPAGQSSSSNPWSSPSPVKTYNTEQSPSKRSRVDDEEGDDEQNSPDRPNRPLFSSKSQLSSPLIDQPKGSGTKEDQEGNISDNSNKITKPTTTTTALESLTDEQIMTMELGMARMSLKSAIAQLRSIRESSDKMKSTFSQLELQNKLLTIENHESAQRYEVENNIVKREVDRLRLDASSSSHGLSDAEVYRRRLQKAKLKLREASKEIEEKEAENEKLRKRLKDGRLHREAMAAAVRDHQQHQHSSRTPHPHASPGHGHHDSESGLAALGMLASQVLSQQASPHKGLMSPVEFEGSPEKRRRGSSASTITIPSEDEEDDDDDEYEVDEKQTSGSHEYDDSSRGADDSPDRPSPRKSPGGSPKKLKSRDESRTLPVAKVLF
jgi:hypothetical protein